MLNSSPHRFLSQPKPFLSDVERARDTGRFDMPIDEHKTGSTNGGFGLVVRPTLSLFRSLQSLLHMGFA